ncbi:Aste57867_20336 [Aphanomyces stellatus]|uniref:Aste57867_20336 protein n=1 Tax=Aphanomyces stellatus TaxID=120398 RepID=A0A485LFB0_9STRA|nr:hypothetical protein As57867_020270 [Aphanomyces stellatus]VFT97023.1 Aste57867_20336 [Aphanomyces stellatus]
MQKHVTDMRGLQRKLLLMGSRVDDDMLGKILLTSVKEAFPTTVEILRSRELSPTLDQITNRLLAKEDEMKSGTTTKRKADDGQLLYTGKPDKNRPFKKQVVKDKCHYCHKVGYHAFECRFKKRDLAKGITRKCIPIEGEDQINILKHDDDDEGFILATTDESPRSDIEDAWILDSAREHRRCDGRQDAVRETGSHPPVYDAAGRQYHCPVYAHGYVINPSGRTSSTGPPRGQVCRNIIHYDQQGFSVRSNIQT